MAMFPEPKDPRPGDGVERSILWPFVYAPLLFIGVIHVATRFAWYLGLR